MLGNEDINRRGHFSSVHFFKTFYGTSLILHKRNLEQSRFPMRYSVRFKRNFISRTERRRLKHVKIPNFVSFE